MNVRSPRGLPRPPHGLSGTGGVRVREPRGWTSPLLTFAALPDAVRIRRPHPTARLARHRSEHARRATRDGSDDDQRTGVSAEQKKLIERAVDAADRRARVLRLAPAGIAPHKKQRPKAHAAQERLLAVLTPAERRQLVDSLVRVIEANQHYARAGALRRRRPNTAIAASR